MSRWTDRYVRRILTLSLAAAAVLCVACQAPAQTVAPVVDTPVVENQIVVGDSISWEAYLGGGIDQPFYGFAGWEVKNVLPYLTDLTNGRPGEIDLVVALGTNDATPVRDGWTANDEALWTQMFALPSRCVTVLLPALGPGATAAHIQQVENARNWITGQGVRTVDWANYFAPGVLDVDGIHLGNTPEGGYTPESVQARTTAINDSFALCA